MRNLSLIVFVSMAFCCRVHAQRRLSLDSVCRILSDSFPQEKVYLQADKDKYLAGDTIWFKAYLTAGGFPAEKSTGLHVELFSPGGSVVQQKFYPVLKGKISLGDMELKDSLPHGLYTLRAYTDYMSNDDPAFFFHYTFPVYAVTSAGPKTKTTKAATSAQETSGTSSPVAGPGTDIQFLPEGGDAVENVLTTMAFRATDRQGVPVQVSGKVVDDLDTAVADIQSVHEGMGTFQYVPWKGRTYAAIVETPYGERRITLPAAKGDGVVLNAKVTPRGVGFMLRADTLSHFLGQPLEVMATMYGQLVFKAKTSLTADAPEISGFIPTSKYVTGILTITLLAADGTPLAERVAFIRPSDIRIAASLTLDTLSLSEKGFNVWNLHIPDTTRGYLSISVTDADALTPSDDRPTILTGLLLNGDLKGYIPHAAWYFKDDADSTQADLDLVMMTHGWRRFDWKVMQQGTFPKVSFTDQNYLSYQGQAFTESGKKVVSNTLLSIFLRGNDSTKKFIIAPLDSSGNFTLDDLVFFDTATAYFQVNKKGYAGLNVQLKLKPKPTFPLDPQAKWGVVFPAANTDTAFVGNSNREADLLAGLRRLQKAKELKEIVIKGHKKSPLQEMEERYTSGMFTGGYGYGFDLVNDHTAGAYTDILSYLQGRVAGVTISGNYPNATVRYRGGTPDFFLDEMNTTIDAIETVPVSEIAFVKVYQPPFFGSVGGGSHGAIAIYTKRGGDETIDEPGLKRLVLPGYTVFRQFYTPAYTPKDTGASALPDYRITLDWLPYQFSGPGLGPVPIRFYNNDACRHIRIVAEGMDEDGKLLHFEQIVGVPDIGAKKQ
jgi:hypothetical protein